MRTELKRPRGTQDILAPESWRVEQLRRLAFDTARQFGFDPLETPAFEQSAVFLKVGESTDVVQHERYAFTDVGGVSLTLRPEGTAAVARAYVENGLYNAPQPVRLFYWAPMFRRERPQALRYRQHTQFGAEMFGVEDPAADAEVMLLSTRVVSLAGLTDPVIRVNSLGCHQCRPAYRQALVAYYRDREPSICQDCRVRLEQNPLRLLDCKVDVEARAGAPDIADYWCTACRAHLDRLMELVLLAGGIIRRDSRLVRGFDYYSRTVFEVGHPQLGDATALFGGGRYDGLVESLDGPNTPGVGFGIGVERLLSALGGRLPVYSVAGCYVAHQPGYETEAFALAERLRQQGLVCYSDVMGRSLKAQIRDAGRRAGAAVIVGSEAVGPGEVMVRNLATGEQEAMAGDPLAIAAWYNRKFGTNSTAVVR